MFEKNIRVYIKLNTNHPNPTNHLIQQAGFSLQKCEGKCEGRKFALTLALTTETPINRAFQTESEGVRAKKEKKLFFRSGE